MFTRQVSAAAVAMLLSLGTQAAFALSAQGTIYINMASGTSEARWVNGATVLGTQALTQVNPCNLVTGSNLLAFSSPSGGVPSAKLDGMGVDQVTGNGTNCAGIDTKGSIRESLKIALGSAVGPSPSGPIRFVKLVLQLELKGTEVRTLISVNDSISGAPTETWEVRGGTAVNPADPGRLPGDLGNPNRKIDCFAGGTDVAPDARDTCIVSINAFGDSFTIEAMKGSTSLEGGRSLPGSSEIHLTDASGIYDCGDTITSTAVSAGGVEIARADCRRLEKNLMACPSTAECVAVPADIRFENQGYHLVLEYDAGDQCVAVQCEIAFAPYDLNGVITRTSTLVPVSPADVHPLAGIEIPKLQPVIVDFDNVNEYYVQHCLEELKRHPTVDVEVANRADPLSPPFVAGEIVSNGVIDAKVISYAEDNGENALVYAVVSGAGDLAAGDLIVGPSGSATVLTAPAPSSFIEELLGDTANPDGAGYLVLDYSPIKPNLRGIQHACNRSVDYELPGFTETGATGSIAEDYIRVIIDAYLQGDIRLAVQK